MNDVIIQDIVDKKIKVIFINEKIYLPLNIQEQIDNYWLKLLKDGKILRRGDVFTISVIETGNSKIKIEVKLTDYAHYMATLNNIIDKKYFCKVIYNSGSRVSSKNNCIKKAPNSNWFCSFFSNITFAS